MPSIHYRVAFSACDAHLIDVCLRLDEPDPEGQRLTLPNWIPGSYMIRDFARHIVSMRASGAVAAGADESVDLLQIDKSTWQAPPGLTSLQVDCRVYAWDLSVRKAHVDRTHAFFNGTSVFLCPEGQATIPVDVVIERPVHAEGDRWQVATAMDPIEVDASGFGRYTSADYDELIDHPFEIGDHTRVEFDVCGVPHAMVLTDPAPFDEERLRRDLQRICEHHVRFFGKPAPMPRYVFMTMLVDSGYGGLEHRASTALLATRAHLPIRGASELDDKYADFLGLCSHEYFHTWNVKRIKPARFVPYALERESYTRLLWFFEGITSYYDDLSMVRAGLIDRNRYTDLVARTITRVQRGPGRLVQSVTDSSHDAWSKFYQKDENAPNAIVSYYAKGALVALCLDARLREATAGKANLDTLMAVLWSRWLVDGAGLAEDEPERVASEIAGRDLSDFFASALYSTDDLPLESALETLGARLDWRARSGAKDIGGRPGGSTNGKESAPETDANAKDTSRWLGAALGENPSGPTVLNVLSGSPAERAGLAAGDRIIAIDLLAFGADEVDDALGRHSVGDDVSLHFLRRGRLMTSTLAIESAPRDTAVVTLRDPDAPSAWLDGSDVTELW